MDSFPSYWRWQGRGGAQGGSASLPYTCHPTAEKWWSQLSHTLALWLGSPVPLPPGLLCRPGKVQDPLSRALQLGRDRASSATHMMPALRTVRVEAGEGHHSCTQDFTWQKSGAGVGCSTLLPSGYLTCTPPLRVSSTVLSRRGAGPTFLSVAAGERKG